ncbi:UDP-glucose 4-epimerase [Rhizobium sp. BK650]|nr:UDP-glucose 4-epimerase [Rhizobium sp. BK650]
MARHLSQNGHVVLGLGHGIWPPLHAEQWGLTLWHNGEIDGPNLRLIQRQSGTPDIVYHLGGGSSVGVAIANPREDFHRTVNSTAELLEWLRLEAPDCRLVAISSAAVYGANLQGPISETVAKNPFSPYGHHKSIMEYLCQSYCDAYGLKVVIARLFSVYGQGLRKQLLWDVCSQLEKNPDYLRLGGGGGELRDWVEVGDVVRALSLIEAHADQSRKVINVGTGIGTNVRAVVQTVVDAWFENAPSRPEIAFSGEARKGDPQSLVADSTFVKSLGFEPRIALKDGLFAYVGWFRSEAGTAR